MMGLSKRAESGLIGQFSYYIKLCTVRIVSVNTYVVFIASESDLRSHVSVTHCDYLPMQCYLCLKSFPPRNSLESTEEKLKEHFDYFHPS